MTINISLRDVVDSDRPIFFSQQLDSTANRMAAFTSKDPSDERAFNAHWDRILADGTIVTKAILIDDELAGHIASFEREGDLEVTYWIGREYWGQGIATLALAEFLGVLRTRPVYARVAKDNIASMRVLEKCGFAMYGEDKGFSNARGEEVEE